MDTTKTETAASPTHRARFGHRYAADLRGAAGALNALADRVREGADLTDAATWDPVTRALDRATRSENAFAGVAGNFDA